MDKNVTMLTVSARIFVVAVVLLLLMSLQLIPEFFQSSGEFLLNSQNLPLGFKQDKTKVMDVELPSWAKGIASKE